MDCMPADLVTKLSCDFYDDSEIEAAKATLFDVAASMLTGSQRYVKRKGNKKNH